MALTVVQLAEKLANERDAIEHGIAKHCPIPVFTTSASGAWTSANDPMQRLMALSEHELKGDLWQSLLASETRHRVASSYAAFIDEKTPTFKIFSNFKTPDHRTFFAVVSLIRINTNYVGFLLPMCAKPKDCPVHHFLMQNSKQALTALQKGSSVSGS